MREEITPEADALEVTPPPAEPVSWTLDTVFVTIEGGERHSLSGWEGTGTEGKTVLVDSEDGSVVFDYDDLTGRPVDVVVYTNGRPPAEPDPEPEA